jgi:hypothetical protein
VLREAAGGQALRSEHAVGLQAAADVGGLSGRGQGEAGDFCVGQGSVIEQDQAAAVTGGSVV